MYGNGIYYDTKPREERDFKEIYPDLDENDHLNVFVVHESVENVGLNGNVSSSLNKPNFSKVTTDSSDLESYKFNRVIAEYGYHELSHSRNHKSLTYVRPFHTENNEDIQEVIKRKKYQVEYDMDEQDYLYLQHRNDSLQNTLKVTPEIFEICITVLEDEWSKLESQMNLITSEEDPTNITLNLDQGMNNNMYGNDDGIVFGTVDDQKCAVCNESDCDNSNAIVFCDGCNIAVHQECYGIAFIPEGQWLCRKCMINQHKQFNCCFCPSKTGAFKQLDNSLWSHVICALWINELYFANPIYMEPIEGIDMIPKSRWKLTCYICKQKTGACVQCSIRSCFQAYHVTCAKRARLYMNMTRGLQGGLKDKLSLKTFCDKHTPHDHDLSVNEIIDGINKTRLYYRDLKLLDLEKDKLTKNKQLDNKLNIFKWRTENNTPIAPQKFSNILFTKLKEFKLDSFDGYGFQQQSKLLKGLGNKLFQSKEQYFTELEQISNDICKYWCLKRESKNGAPLVRKNNNLINGSSILYGNNSLEEVEKKIEFSEIIDEDLNKVIAMNNLNLHKQFADQDLNYFNRQILNKKYFPENQLIGTVLASLLKKFDGKRIISNWKSKDSAISIKQIIHLNETLQIKGIQHLHSKLTQLNDAILAENKYTNNVVRVYGRFYTYFVENLKVYLELEAEACNLRYLAINFTDGEVQIAGMDEDLSDLSDVDNLDDKDEGSLTNFLST